MGLCTFFVLHSHTHRKLEKKHYVSQKNFFAPVKILQSKNKDQKIKPVYCKVMYLLLFNLVWQELRNVTNQEKKKQICFIILFSPSLVCLVVSVLMLCILHLHFYPKQLTLHSIYTFYYIVSLPFIILSVHDCPWSVLHCSVCWSQTKTVHQKCNQSESCHSWNSWKPSNFTLYL